MDILDFDLAHDAEEGVELQLKDPRTGEPLFTKDGRPVTITVAGMNSDAFRGAIEAANKGFVGWPSEMLNSPMFRDRREAADLGVLVAVTLDWQGIEHAGVPLDFNDTTVAAVYRRFVWIRDQVTKTIHDPKAFAATRSDWQPPTVPPKPVPQPDISKW